MAWIGRNWFHVGLLLCAAALTCFLCWAIAQERADSAAMRSQLVTSAQGLDTSRAQLVSEISRPCRGPGKTPEQAADACGLIAETKLAEVHIRDAVTTTQRQVKNSQELMDAASRAILDASIDVHNSTQHADSLLDQARQDLVTSNATISSAKTALDLFSTLESSAQLSADRASDLLKDKRIGQMVADYVTLSDNAASMSTMANKVAQKEGNKILNPSRWDPFKPWAILGAKTAACIWAGAC